MNERELARISEALDIPDEIVASLSMSEQYLTAVLARNRWTTQGRASARARFRRYSFACPSPDRGSCRSKRPERRGDRVDPGTHSRTRHPDVPVG